MKFNELANKMKKLEEKNDIAIPKDSYIICRLDGRGFSKLTKEILPIDKPFDPCFAEDMVNTVNHVMQCGFDVIFGYVQSDEISLLLSFGDNTFNRRLSKITSVLSGEASSFLTLELLHKVSFDCRVSELSSREEVVDYFLWRRSDSQRNCIQGYCYWKLIEQGYSGKRGQRVIKNLSYEDKINFLKTANIDYHTVPNQYKYGTGLYNRYFLKEAFNPKTEQKVICTRKEIQINNDLSNTEKFTDLLFEIISEDRLKNI